jgi:hypothetical protein
MPTAPAPSGPGAVELPREDDGMAPSERDLDDEIRGHLALSIKEAV